MEHCYKLYDVVRIDHFRGFDEYYSIPFGEETAMNGHWEKGPGMELFHALERKLGRRAGDKRASRSDPKDDKDQFPHGLGKRSKKHKIIYTLRET